MTVEVSSVSFYHASAYSRFIALDEKGLSLLLLQIPVLEHRKLREQYDM